MGIWSNRVVLVFWAGGEEQAVAAVEPEDVGRAGDGAVPCGVEQAGGEKQAVAAVEPEGVGRSGAGAVPCRL